LTVCRGRVTPAPQPTTANPQTQMHAQCAQQGALDLLPRFLVAERAILETFAGSSERGGGRHGRGGGRGHGWGGRGGGRGDSSSRDKQQAGSNAAPEAAAEAEAAAAAAAQQDNPNRPPPSVQRNFDWAAALASIPRTLRMMYLHAWQSAIWNAATSARIRQYGSVRPVAGDLVLLDGPGDGQGDAAGDEGVAGEGEELAAAADGGSGEDLDGLYGDGQQPAAKRPKLQEAAAAVGGGDVRKGGGASGGAGDAADGKGGAAALGAAARLARVHEVTEREAEEGRFSIADVVLPLPGSQVGVWLGACGVGGLGS